MTITPEYYTIKDAAEHLNIPYWKLLRAVNAELIPHHCIYNSTKYVKLNEIETAMQSHTVLGGAENGGGDE